MVTFDDTPGANTVEPEDRCPTCGERHIDALVWLDDEMVRCATCGTEYRPLDHAEGGDDDHA